MTDASPMIPEPIVPFVREAGFATRGASSASLCRLLDYLLWYVEEGLWHVQVAGVDYVVGEGQFGLIEPNTSHFMQALTPTKAMYARLDVFYNPRRSDRFPILTGHDNLSAFQHLLQPRLSDRHCPRVPVVIEPSNPVQCRSAMLRLVGTWQDRGLMSQVEANLCATELILTIMKRYSPSEHSTLEPQRSLSWITSYLSSHMAEPLSVSDMADRANLSTSRFATAFRQQFGFSPHQYLMHLRIEHARELLQSTNLTQRQVATACGFSDVHHFSKTFKKLTNVSPGAYRGHPTDTSVEMPLQEFRPMASQPSTPHDLRPLGSV